MSAEFSVLTVCTGNIHRSPLAESLMRLWAGWYLPGDLAAQVTVSSAGLAAAVGAPMDARVLAVVAELGADAGTHRARQLTDDLAAEASLILTASARQRDEILRGSPGALRRTFTIREAGALARGAGDTPRPASVADLAAFVRDLADRRAAGADATDVTDPQGKPVEAYLDMFAEEVPPLADLAVGLWGMPRADRDAYESAAHDRVFLAERMDTAVHSP